MRILIGCEYSGIVRDAFAALGHDAWSCDLLPIERQGQHIQGDVLNVLADGWDMMIAHPPCTYLSYAANHVWNASGREELRLAAASFFMQLYFAPIKKVAVENPVGWMNTVFRKPDQIIHPYYFGERQLKRTCLWLRGLQPLWFWEQDDLFGEQTMTMFPEPIRVDNTERAKKRYFTEANSGGHIRSKSFESIAQAMATQWGGQL